VTVHRVRLVIRAAGGLLWRDGARGRELAIVHRPRRRDWSLPKGKLERGEGFRAAALREVREETGHAARLLGFAGYTLYVAKRRPKVVLFWHMAADGASAFEPSAEVDQVEWLAAADAIRRLTHPNERRLVARAVLRGP
jgi:8-oxo-dGTP pyrophosphatase MutT (NUDIX family)